MAYTSDKKPGALIEVTSLGDSDNIVVDQAGSVKRASLEDLEEKMFDGKTPLTPTNGDVVVVRRGSAIGQVNLENMLPTGSVTNAMLAGSIADSKLNTISTTGKVVNSATTATDGFSGSAYSNAIGANKIVTRDGSGNFAAATITASLSGNASTATTATTATQTANTLTRGSYLTGNNFNGSAATTWAVDATDQNLAGKVVARDGAGNFQAGNISAVGFAGPLTGNVTGNVTGNATGNAGTATTLATGRTIALTGDVTGTTGSFNGSANVSAVTTIANGAVSAAKLTGNAVETAKINNNAVTTAKIADANVTTAKIADANVTTAKIADANVTLGKLDSSVLPIWSAIRVNLSTGTAEAEYPSAWSVGSGGTGVWSFFPPASRPTTGTMMVASVSGGLANIDALRTVNVRLGTGNYTVVVRNAAGSLSNDATVTLFTVKI